MARKEIDDFNLRFKEIMNAEICPYCGTDTAFSPDSFHVYNGIDYGPIWECNSCGSFVGCHSGTQDPLGRLADKELRMWKMSAHSHFDPLWKAKVSNGYSKSDARNAAYKWLSKQLGTREQYTHIGMFNIEQCKKVVELCLPYLK